jgi:hypothetical protein
MAYPVSHYSRPPKVVFQERARDPAQTSLFFYSFIASRSSLRSCTCTTWSLAWKTVFRDKRRTFCSLPPLPSIYTPAQVKRQRNETRVVRPTCPRSNLKAKIYQYKTLPCTPIIQTQEYVEIILSYILHARSMYHDNIFIWSVQLDCPSSVGPVSCHDYDLPPQKIFLRAKTCVCKEKRPRVTCQVG